MSKPLVPEIRFVGYSEPWKHVPFSDIATTFSGLTYSPSSVVERGTLVLRSSNVQNGELTFDDNVFVRPDVVNVKNVEPGDIIMVVRNGSRALIGKHAQVKSPLPNTVIGAFMTGIKSEIPSFTTALFDSDVFNEEVRKGLGATINQITNGMLSDMHFNVCSLDEQKEIGEWFKRLDDMIANAEKEVTRLEKMKIASLQKMFPRPGQTTPEVRFGGFTEPWGTAPLGSLGDTFTGLSGKTKEDFGHGDARFITYMNVFSNPIAKFDKTDKVEIDPSQYSVKYGDILFTTSSETPEEVGMSSVWLFDAPHIYLNSFCFGYRPTTFIESYFWAYVLRSPFMREQITLLAQGISRYNISKIGVMNINLMYPKEKSEQKAIGEYFRNIDGLIEAKRDRIVKLRNIKKACLEKMFVNNTTEQ
jgi:type I restriction enzyme S subunit